MNNRPAFYQKNKKPFKLEWSAKELQYIGSGVIKPHMKIDDILQKKVDTFEEGQSPLWVPYFHRFVNVWRERNNEADKVHQNTFSQYKNATTFTEIKHYPLKQYVHQLITWLEMKAENPLNPVMPKKIRQTGAKYFVRWYSLVMAHEKTLLNYNGDPDKVLISLTRRQAAHYYPIADEYVEAPSASLKRKRSNASDPAIRHLRFFSDTVQKGTECKNAFMEGLADTELKITVERMKKVKQMPDKIAYLKKFVGEILTEYNTYFKQSNEMDIINSIYDLNGRKRLVVSQIQSNHETLQNLLNEQTISKERIV